MYNALAKRISFPFVKDKKENKKNEELMDRLSRKTVIIVITFLLVFGIPAVLAALIGNTIDERLGIKPFGSLALLAVSYVIGWSFAIKTYKDFRKEAKVDIKKDKDE